MAEIEYIYNNMKLVFIVFEFIQGGVTSQMAGLTTDYRMFNCNENIC